MRPDTPLRVAALLVALSMPTVAAVAATCSAPTFGSPEGSLTGSGPGAVALGDLDGDGDLDAIVTNLPGPSLSVLLGRGATRLDPPTTRTLPMDHVPLALVLGDFNGDLHRDVAVASGGPEVGTLDVLLGAGDGTFGDARSVPAGPGTRAIPVALVAHDFDGDGDQDVAVAVLDGLESGSISLLFGDGTGGFGPPVHLPLAQSPVSVVVGDFDSGGGADLAVVTVNPFDRSGRVELLLGDGVGGFAPGAVVPVVPSPVGEVVGDFNGDGRLDIVTASRHLERDNPLSILLGDGAGGFEARVVSPALVTPRALAAADFDSDGRLDVVVLDERGPALTVLEGDGAGGFAAPAVLPLPTGRPTSVAVGDFDADGRVDVVATAFPYSLFVVPNFCGNAADVGVTSSDSPDPAAPRHPVTYTFHVTNHGPDRAGVTLDLAYPVGTNVKDWGTTRGGCTYVSTVRLVTCSVGNLSGSPPGDTATVRLVLEPEHAGPVSVTGTLHTQVVDPVAVNDVVTETTDVRLLGGRMVRLTTTSAGGALLEWLAGDAQTGYVVGRMAGGSTTVLVGPDAPLPATATSFMDPAPVDGQVNCYVVAPVDADGRVWGLSEMLCLYEVASPTGGPVSFTVKLDGDAVLQWIGPGGQTAYVLVAYPLDGSPISQTTFGPGATGAGQSHHGVPTCWVLFPVDGSIAMGNSSALCGVPGVKSLSDLFGPPRP